MCFNVYLVNVVVLLLNSNQLLVIEFEFTCC